MVSIMMTLVMMMTGKHQEGGSKAKGFLAPPDACEGCAAELAAAAAAAAPSQRRESPSKSSQ